jgi:hypothetical protein
LTPEPLSNAKQGAVGIGNAELEACGNSSRTREKVRLGFRRTNFAYGLFEQL